MLREALQNTVRSDFRQSQFVDTRGYPWLYLVVPAERLAGRPDRSTAGRLSSIRNADAVKQSGRQAVMLFEEPSHVVSADRTGGVAQLGERLNGIQEVRGSIPLASMAWRIEALDASSG